MREDKDKTEDGDHGDGKAMAISWYSRLKSQVSFEWTLRKSSLDHSHPSTTQLSSTNNFAKGLIAIFQTIYASVTLYNARAGQINQYGYPAFLLTVVPYIVMSIVNLASAVLTPDYSVMYLVESEAMEEAKKRANAKFHGVVGKILMARTSSEVPDTAEFDMKYNVQMAVLTAGNKAPVIEPAAEMGKPRIDPWTGLLSVYPCHRPCRIISRSSELPRRESQSGKMLIFFGSFALALIPLAVNWVLSKFNPQHSTQAQRVWTMTWLALGICAQFAGRLPVLFMLLMSAPAVAGFVVVCQMIVEFGTCAHIG